MPLIIEGRAGLEALEGKELGHTEWETMDWTTIRAFADATGDHQWIHVDRERIAQESPFGVPIAHGYLTLSLVASRFLELVRLERFAMVINSGTNKVRFPHPVREGDRLRLGFTLAELRPRGDWLEGVLKAVVEVEGAAKPACAAEVVYRFLPA